MARKKKKKGAEINIDATSIIFILVGVILGIFVYSGGSNGIIGNLIKNRPGYKIVQCIDQKAYNEQAEHASKHMKEHN